ncbi:MAG TPA: T9SS type A sorting domain-containing protein [Flavobacterium sp.]|jgi:hypothetical protein
MKKITFLFAFLLSFIGNNYAQSVCTQTFTITGPDSGFTTLTINASDLTCMGTAVPTSIKLVNAAGSLTSGFCTTNGSSWFGFDLSINGAAGVPMCGASFNNVDVTGFNTISIKSHDDDEWTDTVTITIGVEVTFTPTATPGCVALSSPVNGATNINSSTITWPAASGGATGYKLNVGTTPGGTQVLNMFDVGNVLTHSLTGLLPGTTYYVTVLPYNGVGQTTGCTESSFTTCGAVTTLPWIENFDGLPSIGAVFPGCWSVENGPWATGNAGTSTYNDPRSGANYLYNNWGAVNEYIWTLGFNLTAGTSYDFSTFVQGDNGNSWVVDMYANTSPSSVGATQLGGSYAVPGAGSNYGPQPYVEMRRTFTPTTTGTYYFGVRVNEPSNAPWYLAFDDFRLEVTPSCSAPQNLTSSVTGFTTASISWAASSSVPANGYEYYYSTSNTTPTDATVASGTTAAGVTTANLTGLTAESTYYFWVKAICSATSESSWGGPASFFTGYCTSVPVSNDGAGVTNVQVGSTNFPTADVTYVNHSTPVVDVAQGVNTNVQISFATGYTYNTNIWIDFNNNIVFEASELVYSGESPAPNPSVLNASFIMPASAALGQHRMRIGTADSGQVPPNPCFSGFYGVTLDFQVNVITASCVAPTATTTLAPDCANNQYFVDVNVTGMGNGTPSITSGTTTYPVTAVGVVHVGPFANGSTNVLTLNHGSDAVCNLPLGSFTYICPPANDSCGTAIAIAAFPYTNTQDATTATNNAGFITSCTIGGASMNDGVWYTVVGNGLTLTAALSSVGAWDPQIDVYSGSCGTFTCVASADNGGTNGAETVLIENSVLGTTYYINIGHYSGFTNSPEGLFTLNVTSASTAFPDYVSLQAPVSQTITQGGTITVYGQIYEAGLTDVAPVSSQAPGIEAWVGYSTTNTNPSTWTNWTVATHNAAHVSNNDEYMATIGANLTPGTYYYATRFRLDNGAYAYGGVDSAGNGNFWNGTTHNSGVLTVTAPPAPANDNCSSAVMLTAGGVYGQFVTDGTNIGATASSTETAPTTCFGYVGGDVWYSVVVPASGSLTIETGNTTTGTSGFDSALTVYSGSCGALTQVGCDDDSAATGGYSQEIMTGLTPGSTLYVRVYEYNNDGMGAFGISAYDASLASASFDNANFSFYPNPVKDVLNLSYTENISNVSVFNLLGQEVVTRSINATTGQVDMSRLASGTYLVKVTADQQTNTIKVIKE